MRRAGAFSPAGSVRGTSPSLPPDVPSARARTPCPRVTPLPPALTHALWWLLRVFDKIKSRNAHMKRHRLQDHVEPVVRVKWPVKPFQLKEDEEEEMGADIGPLQW